MGLSVQVIRNQDSVDVAEPLMRTRHIRRLPVVDHTWKLAGLLSLNDLARESGQRHGRRRTAVRAHDVVATLPEICERYGTSHSPISPS